MDMDELAVLDDYYQQLPGYPDGVPLVAYVVGLESDERWACRAGRGPHAG